MVIRYRKPPYEGAPAGGSMVEVTKQMILKNWITIDFSEYEPFFHDEFVDYFENKGYSRSEQLSSDESTLITMKKGDSIIQFNTEQDRLRLSAPTPEKMTAELEIVQEFIKSVKQPTTSKVAWYEAFYEALVLPDFHPLRVRSSAHDEWFETLLGRDVSPFTIDYCSTKEDVGGTSLNELNDWFYISLSPHVDNPRFLRFMFICREKSSEKAVRIYGRIQEIMLRLLERFAGDG